MGFFDRFRSKSSPTGAMSSEEDRNSFAQLVIKALRRAGEAGDIHYDDHKFLVQISETAEPRTWLLERAYAEYAMATESQRPFVLEHHVRSCIDACEPIPARFEDALPRLFPRIRERAWHELVRFERQDVDDALPASREFAGEFRVGLVCDWPTSYAEITERQLKHWGIDLNVALARVSKRFRDMARSDPFEELAPGVFLSRSPPSNAPARLVAYDSFRELALRGDPIVVAPNQEVIGVTGAKDRKGLEELAGWCLSTVAEARHVSFEPLRLENGRWANAIDKLDPEMARWFRKLMELSANSYYDFQKKWLEKLPQYKDIFVASHTNFAQGKTGEILGTTRCVWGEIDSLLPRAEVVSFVQWDYELERGKPLCEAPWERVRSVLGHLMEPIPIYPERFRVRRFPTHAELALLEGPGFVRHAESAPKPVSKATGGADDIADSKQIVQALLQEFPKFMLDAFEYDLNDPAVLQPLGPLKLREHTYDTYISNEPLQYLCGPLGGNRTISLVNWMFVLFSPPDDVRARFRQEQRKMLYGEPYDISVIGDFYLPFHPDFVTFREFYESLSSQLRGLWPDREFVFLVSCPTTKFDVAAILIDASMFRDGSSS